MPGGVEGGLIIPLSDSSAITKQIIPDTEGGEKSMDNNKQQIYITVRNTYTYSMKK